MNQLDEYIAVGGQNTVAVLRGQENNWSVLGLQQISGDVCTSISVCRNSSILFETRHGMTGLLTAPGYDKVAVLFE